MINSTKGTLCHFKLQAHTTKLTKWLGSPSLSRSQKRRGTRRRNTRGRRRSEGSWVVAACRSPPDLQGARTYSKWWQTEDNIIGWVISADLYLRCQTVPECMAPHQSSLLLHSYQKPVGDRGLELKVEEKMRWWRVQRGMQKKQKIGNIRQEGNIHIYRSIEEARKYICHAPNVKSWGYVFRSIFRVVDRRNHENTQWKPDITTLNIMSPTFIYGPYNKNSHTLTTSTYCFSVLL